MQTWAAHVTLALPVHAGAITKWVAIPAMHCVGKVCLRVYLFKALSVPLMRRCLRSLSRHAMFAWSFRLPA